MKIFGVDPGVHGGLALVITFNHMAPELVDATDIPTVGVGAKERIDALALHVWITKYRRNTS